jgi:hypothetical protein
VNIISKFLYEKRTPSPEKMFRGDKYEFFSRTKFAGENSSAESVGELFPTRKHENDVSF